MAEKAQISSKLETNIQYFHTLFGVDKNFDIIYRTLQFGGKEACLYCVDGFTKDEVLQRLMQTFSNISSEDMPHDAHTFSKKYLSYIEVGLEKEKDIITTSLLSGMSLLFVDGFQQCLIIDARTYPVRSVQEPEKDRVIRGSRDGFVETLIFNTALIRRRIRDPKLCNEIFQLGDRSHTDIVISYIEDRVDKKLLADLKERISHIEVDALSMNQESLAECLYRRKWVNPFPKYKFSERPDTTAAHLLEGNIVILVDNSPAAMILPSSIFDIIEETDDYYFPPVTGTYLRFSRFIIILTTLFLTPVFLLLMQNPEWIPEWLQFIKFKETVNVPIIFQFLLLELAIDGLRLAALNTPSMFSTPLSIMAALILGDFSVSSGWFNSETMLYMAFVAVANYSQANFELGYALKFMRMILLVLTAVFNVWGFAAGVILILCSLAFNHTIAGKSYLYPLIPFSAKEFGRRFLRLRLPHSVK